MALGDFGVRVSPNTVARLLHQMGYSLRVNHKSLSTDFSPDRNDPWALGKSRPVALG
jgi:Rhodopirellula transposase DDE domain